MRKVFIADAHLRNESDKNYRLLLEFFGTLPGNTDTLFILGDLFEFWIGYPDVPFRHYFTMLEELRRLREKGVNIVYFEGNHDFHMGPFFENTLKATIYNVPAILEIEGKRVYLSHGDQINRADYSHRLFRFLLHNSLTGGIIPLVPPFVASYIAERLGRASRKNHDMRRGKWDYPSILRRFAAERFREGCDTVIVGHFHLPLIERTTEGAIKTLISLGDWITHFTYGEWEEGEFSLRCYSP
jgi:UDP-2,3-diacylglucosamine hydrolase